MKTRVALAILMLSATMAIAVEPKCLTLAEARATWPGVHLYWYRDHERRRCWSNRRGDLPKLTARGRGSVPRVTFHEPAPSPPLPPTTAITDVAAILASPRESPSPPADPQWQWVETASDGDEVVYSTFAGAIPDEWPIDHARPSLMRIWMLAATFAAMVASAIAVWFNWLWLKF